MIYITLGTQPCDFTRCLKLVEDIIEKYGITEEIIAQVGYTSYRSDKFKCYEFLPQDQYLRCISDSRVVISHAGTGALFSSIKKGKKVIAVARLKKYGEMVNDHQAEIVKKLSEEGYILDGTHSLDEAWEKLESFEPRACDFECSLPEVIGEQIDNWLK